MLANAGRNLQSTAEDWLQNRPTQFTSTRELVRSRQQNDFSLGTNQFPMAAIFICPKSRIYMGREWAVNCILT